MNGIVRIGLMLAMGLALAPQPKYTGCVMKSEGGDFTFCEPAHCSLLKGEKVGERLVGHVVIVRGIVTNATDDEPRTLSVSEIVEFGKVCDQHCSLKPPGKRGVFPKEKPGSEGGTPGLVPKQTPQ